MAEMTDDERYAAIRARDARFDGMFFTCVRSTGIFCRPSCPSRTPRRDRVEFAPSAAAAVERGYRACKRCGPLAPPGADSEDPAGELAHRALTLIHAGALDGGPEESTAVGELADRLHVTERTLHRALRARTGSGAVAHARMARARRAHELLRSTSLAMGDIAAAAGFGSERQLHETVSRTFGRAPSAIRELAVPRRGMHGAGVADGGDDADSAAVVSADLAVRRPFHAAGLANWFAARAIPGVEHVDGLLWTRAVALPHGPAVLQVDLGVADGPLPLTAHLRDLRDYAAAVSLARHVLDLDADPCGIDAGLTAAMPALAPLVQARPGVRIPGTPSLAEALLWAIVGQQISTVRARALLEGATDLAGEKLPATMRTAHVHRLAISPAEAGARAEEWFRGPGARRRTLAAALAAPPDPHLPVPELREQLLTIRGIGPWTADYALLRGARAIDVAPPRDVALLAVARALDLAGDFAALDQVLGAASPWRSYAVMQLWHHRDSLPAHQRTLRKDRS
ncbi:MAG: Ada metal-binding domain-containing protein [Brachybacterium sp.]|uniref:Ada metal-binding domain-containing protein n=1 Tax=Brachybacterium sp. TaxID=1891286 RepID=UPI00264D1BE4|nr:helix-turn-helix domain-containing protein [Brachybacterium sp.]MDN6328354.1 helix-turn-helix domain-containing protein [Brachybacterium sp.]